MTEDIKQQGYNQNQAAKFLGIAPNTLVKLINDGRIKYIQAGRRKIFSLLELEAFLKGE